MKWKEKGYNKEWYIAEDGEIIGEIYRMLGGEYVITPGNQRYYNKETAKAAVEKIFKKQERKNEL